MSALLSSPSGFAVATCMKHPARPSITSACETLLHVVHHVVVGMVDMTELGKYICTSDNLCSCSSNKARTCALYILVQVPFQWDPTSVNNAPGTILDTHHESIVAQLHG